MGGTNKKSLNKKQRKEIWRIKQEKIIEGPKYQVESTLINLV